MRKSRLLRIAIVHWLINDVGGINSWTENFLLGLEQLGYTPKLFYGSCQRKLNCSLTKKIPRSRRWHLLPSVHLSYMPEHVESSLKELNKFDVIVFAHPSPHPTKSNTRNSSFSRNWQLFYTNTSALKICIFHDRHWDRTNKWIEEVRDEIHYVHAAQHHFIEAVHRFTQGKVESGWGIFPLVVSKNLESCGNKRRRYVLATQWLALKNHRYILPNLDKLIVPLHSYGSGQTYHILLDQIRKVFREDHHNDVPLKYNPKSHHIHYGHTEYRCVLRAMQKAWFSLDLSTQGMTNMTHWEPMSVGTVSVIENRVVSDPFCEIPRDCCLQFDLDNVIEDLNKIALLTLPELEKVRLLAWKFAQRCKCLVVSRKILESAGVE